MIKIFILIPIFFLLILLLHLFASGKFYFNAIDEEIVVREDKGKGEEKSKISILSYNMAYGRGSKDDKGDLRDKKTILDNLEKLVGLISDIDPDILLLQEIDFDSKRTHHINQFTFLMDRLKFRYGAYVVTWRKGYVPYPIGLKFWQHYGKMVSGQAILSKYEIKEHKRIPLPQPDENFKIYNNYYITRCFEKCIIRFGKIDINLFNVHLEAFSEKNRILQAGMLAREINSIDKRDYLIVTGDFNSLPPYANVKKGFWDEPTDFTTDTTIQIMLNIPNLEEIIKRDEYLKDENLYFTFLSEKPTRRLDYIFYGNRGFELKEGRIVSEAGILSDHLPVWARFKINR